MKNGQNQLEKGSRMFVRCILKHFDHCQSTLTGVMPKSCYSNTVQKQQTLVKLLNNEVKYTLK